MTFKIWKWWARHRNVIPHCWIFNRMQRDFHTHSWPEWKNKHKKVPVEWESRILTSWYGNLTTKCKTSQFCRANNQKIINLYILGARGFLVFLRRCHYEKKPLAPKVNLYDKEMLWPTLSWSFLEALISCCFSCSKQHHNDVSLLKKCEFAILLIDQKRKRRCGYISC